MPVPMPLVAINDDLMINLFNICRVNRVKAGNAEQGLHRETQLKVGQVVVQYTGGWEDVLEGEEAEVFLAYLGSFCERAVRPLVQPAAAHAASDEGSLTGRNFGDLVDGNDESPPPPHEP
jgi:hypothetical protein